MSSGPLPGAVTAGTPLPYGVPHLIYTFHLDLLEALNAAAQAFALGVAVIVAAWLLWRPERKRHA